MVYDITPITKEKKVYLNSLTKEQISYYRNMEKAPRYALRNYTRESVSIQRIYANSVNLFLQHMSYKLNYGVNRVCVLPVVFTRMLLEGDKVAYSLLSNNLITPHAKAKIITGLYNNSQTILGVFMEKYPDLMEDIYDGLALRTGTIFLDKFIEKLDARRIRLIHKNHKFILNGYLPVLDTVLSTRNPSFILEILRIDPKGTATLFHNILPRISPPPEEFLIELVKIRGKLLEYIYISDSEVTDAIKHAAVSQSGTSIRYIPEEDRTQDLCDIAVIKAASALRYVPKEKQKKNLIIKKVLEGKNALRYVKR